MDKNSLICANLYPLPGSGPCFPQAYRELEETQGEDGGPQPLCAGHRRAHRHRG